MSEDVNHGTIKTPKFSLAGITCRAKCVKVYDGDTCHFVINQPGSGELRRYVCRLLGYNSAEMKTKDPVEKEAAKRAQAYLAGEILDKVVTVTFGENDQYGRPLTSVITADGKNICELMISGGYGKPYSGRGEKKW